MGEQIDKILERYYKKEIDLLGVRKELLILFSVSGMLPDDEKIAQVACDEGQQDWNDIRHQKTYIDAFIDGANYMRTEVEIARKSNYR